MALLSPRVPRLPLASASAGAGVLRYCIRWGHAKLQGAREEMEDEVVLRPGSLLHGFSFAAVLDGHAGATAVGRPGRRRVAQEVPGGSTESLEWSVAAGSFRVGRPAKSSGGRRRTSWGARSGGARARSGGARARSGAWREGCGVGGARELVGWARDGPERREFEAEVVMRAGMEAASWASRERGRGGERGGGAATLLAAHWRWRGDAFCSSFGYEWRSWRSFRRSNKRLLASFFGLKQNKTGSCEAATRSRGQSRCLFGLQLLPPRSCWSGCQEPKQRPPKSC